MPAAASASSTTCRGAGPAAQGARADRSNLNQLVRLAHQGKAGILPDALRELLIKLCEQVAAEGTAR